MSRHLHRAVTGCALAAALIAASSSAPVANGDGGLQTPPVQDRDARFVTDFQARVNKYAALHQKLESTLGPFPTGSTPELINTHQRALEHLIVRERAGAKKGDIFTEPIRAYFRRQLLRVFGGPDGPAIRDAIMDENTRAIRLTVNARYPDTLPRSTVPTQVLLALPRLPEELEYRFVGDRLALLDVHSDTVVDFMDRAVPR
jgi:hypothetical protein